MTIVLASIAEKGNAIVMVAERMLSMPEMTYQFEHDTPKIRKIANYLVGYAGPTTFADDILSHGFKNTDKIKEFIEELSGFRVTYRNRIAERFLLESIGTNLTTFLENPQYYPESLRESIFEQLQEDLSNKQKKSRTISQAPSNSRLK
jgi:hypothetical protein